MPPYMVSWAPATLLPVSQPQAYLCMQVLTAQMLLDACKAYNVLATLVVALPSGLSSSLRRGKGAAYSCCCNMHPVTDTSTGVSLVCVGASTQPHCLQEPSVSCLRWSAAAGMLGCPAWRSMLGC